jgi:hypothetical protein
MPIFLSHTSEAYPMGSTRRGNGFYVGLPATSGAESASVRSGDSLATRVIEADRAVSRANGESVSRRSGEGEAVRKDGEPLHYALSPEQAEGALSRSGPAAESAEEAVKKRAFNASGTRKTWAIAQLAIGASVSEVARHIRVHRSTVHRWLEEPDFARQLVISRAELIEKAFDLHIYASLQGTRKLLEYLDSDDVRLAFWAARTLVPLKSVYTQIDQERRIRMIEDVDSVEG